jgi:hypothetical protein
MIRAGKRAPLSGGLFTALAGIVDVEGLTVLGQTTIGYRSGKMIVSQDWHRSRRQQPT